MDMMKGFPGKIILVLFVLFMGIVAGGCATGDTGDTGDFTAGQEQEIQQGAGEEVPAEKELAGEELLVYCGAGLRLPMEEIAAMFQEETGATIQFSYGGSAQCVGQILLVDKGDVFLPGDVEELKELVERDKIDLQKPVVLHIPVLAVPEGNPAGIMGLEDLAKDGVKVVLGDPEANPIGKLANKALKDHGLFEKVEPNVVARAATVNELFAYLALEQADVAVIWEDNLVGHEKIDMVDTVDFSDYIKNVPVVSLKCSTNPAAAELFVEYVAGEKAAAVWEKCGFRPSTEVN